MRNRKSKFEALETRKLMTVDTLPASIELVDGTIEVWGTNQAEEILIDQQANTSEYSPGIKGL